MKRLFFLLIFFVLAFPLLSQDILDIPGNPCPMEGRPSEKLPAARANELKRKNRLKNRYTAPRPSDLDRSVTLEKLLQDADENDRKRFDENKAVTLTGYVVYVANSGSRESCNCGTGLSAYTDTHIEIALDPGEEKGDRTLTVEITPRFSLNNGDSWKRANLKKLLGEKITVTGWLFYDAEHEPQSRNINPETCENFPNKRQTCWEIHPITSFSVVKASVKSFAPAGSAQNTGTDSSGCTTQVKQASPCNDCPDESGGGGILLAVSTGIIGLVSGAGLSMVNSMIERRSEKKKTKKLKAAELLNALSDYIDYMITVSWFPIDQILVKREQIIDKLIEQKSQVVKARINLAAYDYERYSSVQTICKDAIDFDTRLSDMIMKLSANMDNQEKAQLNEQITAVNNQLSELLERLNDSIADTMK